MFYMNGKNPTDEAFWTRPLGSFWNIRNFGKNQRKSSKVSNLLFKKKAFSNFVVAPPLNRDREITLFFSCVSSSKTCKITDKQTNRQTDKQTNSHLAIKSSGLVRTGQEWSGLVKTGQEWSGLVRNDQGWSEMIRTGQEWSVLVRNDQNWSGKIRTGQEWSGLCCISRKRIKSTMK